MPLQINDTLIQRALAVLRIVTAYLLIQHGTAKHFGFPHVAMFDNLVPLSLPGIAGILEIVGGALLLIGLFTRPVAFVLSGLLAFAYFIGHAPRGNVLSPMLNGGEAAVLFCFIFLFMAVAGGGSWSLDARRAPPRYRGLTGAPREARPDRGPVLSGRATEATTGRPALAYDPSRCSPSSPSPTPRSLPAPG